MDIDPEGFAENVAIDSRGGVETGGWSGDVDRPRR
jgi:hypothetical protein